MTNWKVTLELNGATIVIDVKAKSFSDAYINSQIEHPGSKVLSIKEVEPVPIKGKN